VWLQFPSINFYTLETTEQNSTLTNGYSGAVTLYIKLSVCYYANLLFGLLLRAVAAWFTRGWCIVLMLLCMSKRFEVVFVTSLMLNDLSGEFSNLSGFRISKNIVEVVSFQLDYFKVKSWCVWFATGALRAVPDTRGRPEMLVTFPLLTATSSTERGLLPGKLYSLFLLIRKHVVRSTTSLMAAAILHRLIKPLTVRCLMPRRAASLMFVVIRCSKFLNEEKLLYSVK